ncbi:hypothetical protein [uncultured Microbacterium sp.]|uniref:Type II toxin-antitoxin system VapC family toxin n=1 Tax=uncultured Microbacterium sp. TaxID=191216 RepID=A0A1Y5P890_9MICO|nr:hypothetical protein [uncultured Microbacterium sp.]SBS74915.1 conserved hypothetical protein [uncultured Microbacterium sp.]
MTRYAIDSGTALRLVEEGRAVSAAHSLVGPAVLRSHALGALYRAVRDGTLAEKEGRARLEGIAALKIRLLGDRVSRATAWKIASGLGWEDTAAAEYLAVATLQADALIAADPTLAAAADGVVALAEYDDLFR